jgi:hypothetical protein
MGSDVIRDMFLLFALLIGVAYFVGLSTDANSFGNTLVKLIYAGTGRNNLGQFAPYPSGGGQVQGG